MEEATRELTLPPFSGPPKAVLTAFSAGLFWYLQPRVEKICKDLYKKVPEEVSSQPTHPPTHLVTQLCAGRVCW